MQDNLNRQIILAARPANLPRESDFNLVEYLVPEPREGEVLVGAIWLSLDPYQRGGCGPPILIRRLWSWVK